MKLRCLAPLPSIIEASGHDLSRLFLIYPCRMQARIKTQGQGIKVRHTRSLITAFSWFLFYPGQAHIIQQDFIPLSSHAFIGWFEGKGKDVAAPG